MNLVKDYKQYFTPEKLAKYMVSIIPDSTINSVVDLSMGECGLLEEAKKRWNNAELYGADIDKNLIEVIKKRSPYIKTFQGDSLSNKLELWKAYKDIVSKTGFDLAIANPPFNFFEQELVEIEIGTKMTLPIEMRFLLKYIDIVREEGYICIILPYGFLALDSYKEFRKWLLGKVKILKVIKIFERCFEKIDADTCLILMQKKRDGVKNIQSEISIEYLDSTYKLTNEHVACVSGVDRWDLEYQCLQEETKNALNASGFKVDILGSYIRNCRRGKSITKNKEVLTEKGTRFIHTTDLKKLYISSEKKQYVVNDKQLFANAVLHENDLLVARVGQGCIGKVGIVSKRYRNMIFSDCIYAIDVVGIDPHYLALFLASKFGQMQIKGLAKGSCSKYITREELYNICILVPDWQVQDYFAKKYKLLLSKPGRVDKDKLFIELIDELDKEIRMRG